MGIKMFVYFKYDSESVLYFDVTWLAAQFWAIYFINNYNC